MAVLLNIDTATEYAGVCLSRDGHMLQLLESPEQKNHAAFVQPAIQQLLSETGCQLTDIDAVAVTAGPGSYTGLRVGLASAKGICYALNKPLILINTLEVIANNTISNYQPQNSNHPPTLFCPLIDARRMEVFTAVYDASLTAVMPPQAMLLDAHAFGSLLDQHQVVFSGSGHYKLKEMLSHRNAIFSTNRHSVTDLAMLAHKAFEVQQFANLAYSEPLYVKEFFHPSGT